MITLIIIVALISIRTLKQLQLTTQTLIIQPTPTQIIQHQTIAASAITPIHQR